MNESLQYGVYNGISFSNPFSHSSWENIIEGIFPSEYNPDMSFETKREMHTQLIYTLMEDTRGWMEWVRIKDLRDPELKKQYISFYSDLNKGNMTVDEILNNCMATQVSLDKLPRTLDYKPDKRYTYLFTTVQKFFFYYYNKNDFYYHYAHYVHYAHYIQYCNYAHYAHYFHYGRYEHCAHNSYQAHKLLYHY